MKTKKTIAERIAEFRAKNVEVDQSYFPNVYLTWQAGPKDNKLDKFYNASKGIMYDGEPAIIKRMKESKHFNMKCKPCYMFTEKASYSGFYRATPTKMYLTNAGSHCRHAYFKSDGRLKIMEVSVCTIDTSRYHKGDEPRKWKREIGTSTVYFADGEKTPYDGNGNVLNRFSIKTSPYYLDIKEWSKYIYRALYNARDASNFATFAKNNLVVEKGDIINPYTHWEFSRWVLYHNEAKKGGPKSKVIDRLNALVTKNITEIANEYACEFKPGRLSYFYVDVLGEDLIVFREFCTFKPKVVAEGHRLFLAKDHSIYHSKWNGKEWINSASSAFFSSYYDSCGRESQTALNVGALETHPMFRHIYSSVAENFAPAEFMHQLILFYNCPVIEQFYKTPFKDVAKALNRENPDGGNDKKVLSTIFAPLPSKSGNNLYSRIGMSKQQLAAFNNFLDMENTAYSRYYLDRRKHVIKIIKRFSKASSIANLDEEKFGHLLDYAEQLLQIYDHEQTMQEIEELTQREAKSFYDKLYLIANKIPITSCVRYGWTEKAGGMKDVFNLVSDTLKTWKNFPENMRPDIDWHNWKKISDIESTHNNLVTLSFALEEKIRMERDKEKLLQMQKIDAKRKQFEYQDDDFIIRLPKAPYEITMEGKALHHCVGGYVSDHISGWTTILFLRRAGNPDCSFYTIEVRDISKKDAIPFVVQIHGFGNKWLGNDPDAVPTVMRWLQKNGIRCEDKILLSTAKGYSGYNAPLIPRPIVI